MYKMNSITLKRFCSEYVVTADNFDQYERALKEEVDKSLDDFKKLLSKGNMAAATRSRGYDQNIIFALKKIRRQKIDFAKKIKKDRSDDRLCKATDQPKATGGDGPAEGDCQPKATDQPKAKKSKKRKKKTSVSK